MTLCVRFFTSFRMTNMAFPSKGFDFYLQSAINNRKCIESAFECSGGETLDQIFLGYENEDDPGEGCQKRTRAHLVPVDEDVSDAVENPHCDGDRKSVV